MIPRLSKVLNEVPGWLTPEEAELLYTIVRDWPAAGRSVELGSFQGRSTICMALALEETHPESHRILSIDTHKGSDEHQPGGRGFDPTTVDEKTGKINTEHLLRKNLHEFEIAHRVEIIVGDSVEQAQQFHDSARVLFVDANHATEFVRADISAWSRHLAPSGCLLLHDVGAWPGPTIVAGELLAQGYNRVEQAGTLLALRPE